MIRRLLNGLIDRYLAWDAGKHLAGLEKRLLARAPSIWRCV